jgi:hypothetical protein
MTKKIFLLAVLTLIGSGVVYVNAAEQDRHFATALKLVEMTFNKEAVYQQFMYFGILPAKERYENDPKTKEYSKILVGVVKEVLDKFFNDPQTQNKLKLAYASIYSEEFTEKELLEIIQFNKTDTGKKVFRKFPIVMEKGRRKEAEVANELFSPKYKKVLFDKLEKLQKEGKLPKEF